ncbi:hypothetical protein VNO78_09450 [Psophocarpus tetragonolobus]|uniref:DUF7054 domain-containing protein n=1 Tax=Psophocarpus tetragonolobus TaxID=3891 RepID=A0AAN9XT82_PSOTE
MNIDLRLRWSVVIVNGRNLVLVRFHVLPSFVKGSARSILPLRFRLLQTSLVLPLPRRRPINKHQHPRSSFPISQFRSLLLPSFFISLPTMLLTKQKKNLNVRRFLVSINVLGSAGPIRFVVNDHDPIATVIETALKCYAREGRLPLLGTHITGFSLYCPHLGPDALSPWDTIGSHGVRNFMLCKKSENANEVADDGNETLPRRGSGTWKSWFNKSLNLKISSH